MTTPPGLQNGMHRRRLYGRRRGRAMRAGQRALVQALLPRLTISLTEGAMLDPRKLFAAPIDEVWLEVGFGAGEHLAYQADTHPRYGLIGSEVYEPGIAKLLTEISVRRLDNIRLFIDDARLLLAALTSRSISRVFILFPDPWPKERHKKRRVVATETLDDLARIMTDGTELRLATDDADYAQWIAERANAHAAFEAVAQPARPGDWPPTRYEKKAAAQGRKVQLFTYRRRARSHAES
jgi:tRNA (guanine-N7-)-methyltransferase